MSTEQPVTNVGETDTSEQSTETQSETVVAPAPAVTSESIGGSSAAAAVTQREDEEEARPAGEDFGQLLDQFEQEQSTLQEGEVVRGTVVGITERGVVIDFGYKSEGIVNQNEFMEDGQITVKPGDEVDVLVKNMETGEGYPLLSRADAVRLRAWDDLEKAFNENTPIKGRVAERIKGGLRVDVNGIAAFLPGSQVDVRPVRNLDSLRGREIEAKVIKLNRKRSNVVLSRKAVLEERNEGRKGETLGQIEEDIIVEYGAHFDPHLAILRALTENVRAQNAVAAGFVHWGATSQDLCDTALVLLLQKAQQIFEADLRRLERALRRLSQRHRSTVMLGRTWLQAAPPVTFGLKAAGWYGAIDRGHQRLTAAFADCLVLQFGGASGTLAALGKDGPRIAQALADEIKTFLNEKLHIAVRTREVAETMTAEEELRSLLKWAEQTQHENVAAALRRVLVKLSRKGSNLQTPVSPFPAPQLPGYRTRRREQTNM
jgi:predicted RNA-binding protein with RPS1 domain